jgi:hypothetical protein
MLCALSYIKFVVFQTNTKDIYWCSRSDILVVANKGVRVYPFFCLLLRVSCSNQYKERMWTEAPKADKYTDFLGDRLVRTLGRFRRCPLNGI